MKRFLLLLVLMMISGCAPWQRAESPFESDSLNITVDLPSGWMRQNTSKYLLVTRDGVLLQKIVVNRMDLKEEKQFSRTKKRIKGDMLPQEVAEVVLDDFQSDQDLLGIEVQENTPASVGKVPGFKTRFSYKTKGGLKYQCVYYGALAGGYYYSIFYLAPSRHYFARDLDAFEQMVKTLRLTRQS